MIDQLRSEVLKLRSVRVTLVVVALGATLEIVFTVLQVVLLDDGQIAAVARQTASLKPSIVLPVFAAVLGVLVVVIDTRHDVVVPVLVAQPRRARLVRAKVAVAAGFGLVGGMVAVVPAKVIGWSVLATRVDPSVSAAEVTGRMIGTVLGVGALATAGAGAALVARGQVSSLAVVAVIAFIVPPLSLLAGPGVYAVTPSGALDSVALQRAAEPALLNGFVAALVLVVVAASAVTAGAARFGRRDYT